MSTAVYQAVTDRVVAALKEGVVPWRRPWQLTPEPENLISRRPYRGVNILLLSLQPFGDHRWLTFRQAKKRGGYVKRGAESSLVVFWKRWEVERVSQEGQEPTSKAIPLLRTYHVFNVEQCEGLSLPDPCLRSGEDRIENVEAVIAAMPKPPMIREIGEEAWYRPRQDLVQVPRRDRFDSVDSFYGTLFHELGHATGHEKRLGRSGIMDKVHFGSADYSREELVAELASAFCCASLGLDNSLVGHSASYVKGWLQALQDDPKALTIGAAQAQRAADYIRGLIEGPDEVLYRLPA